DIIEVEGELKVERYENTISVVYIESDGRKFALSDFGFGYSQIIPIFLKIISKTTTSKLFTSGGTIIIEEPEANLHPKLQSKLADVFVCILKHYPQFNFIIETH